MTSTYDIGDSVRLTFSVTVDGVLTDATVALTITDPSGNVTTPGTSHPSTGVYSATLAATSAGVWIYRWTATGAATTAEDGQFIVEANAAADVYATVAEVQARFGISGSTDVELIEKSIRAASRSIDKACGRRFYRDTAATARVFYPDTACAVNVDDFHTTTGLVVKTDDGGDGTFGTTWAIGEYELHPLNGVVDGEAGWPYNRIRSVQTRLFPSIGYRASIQVTAQWGWAAVPTDIREACLVAAAELNRLKDAPFGVLGFGDFGARIRDNPVVMRLIAPYRRSPVLVA